VEKAKGIRVAEWLVSLKTDLVLLKEDVRGKGPAYVFRDAGVEIVLTAESSLGKAIVAQIGASD
jgi:predicted Fe-Mo cluster-binding NifX family protein